MQLYRLTEDKFSSKKDVKYGSKGDLVCVLSNYDDVCIVDHVSKVNNEYFPTGQRFSINEKLLQKI